MVGGLLRVWRLFRATISATIQQLDCIIWHNGHRAYWWTRATEGNSMSPFRLHSSSFNSLCWCSNELNWKKKNQHFGKQKYYESLFCFAKRRRCLRGQAAVFVIVSDWRLLHGNVIKHVPGKIHSIAKVFQSLPCFKWNDPLKKQIC